MKIKAIIAGIRLNEAACRCRYRELACRKSEISWGAFISANEESFHLCAWEIRVVTSPN